MGADRRALSRRRKRMARGFPSERADQAGTRPQDPRAPRRRSRRRTRESRATRTENLRADAKRSRIVTSRPVTEPIWKPSPQRVAESNLQRFIAAQRSRLPRRRLRVALRLEHRETGRVLGSRLEVLRHPLERGLHVRAPGRRQDAGRALVRRRDAELHRESAAAASQRAPRSCSRTSAASAASSPGRELASQVAGVAAGLRALGVGRGDRVAGFVANRPEAVVAMLAAASLGAVWSSCSPDFGADAVLDRFGQIAPKVLFATDGYFYDGKSIDSLPLVRAIAARLPELRAIVVIPYRDGDAGAARLAERNAVRRPGRSRARSSSPRPCRSRIRSTFSIPPAPPACRNASCTAQAARCSSIARSTCCTRTSGRATSCSTSRRRAG